MSWASTSCPGQAKHVQAIKPLQSGQAHHALSKHVMSKNNPTVGIRLAHADISWASISCPGYADHVQAAPPHQAGQADHVLGKQIKSATQPT